MENYIESLSARMTFLTARRDVISNNITNSNTPGFKAQDVVFRDELNRNMDLQKPNSRHIGGAHSGLYQTHGRHISLGSQNSQIEYIVDENKVNTDGNSVDVTTQMIELMKVSQLQSVIVNAVNTQSEINSAARGR